MAVIRVKEKYRKNDLSFSDGGFIVCVKRFGQIYEYDNIKNTKKYIEKIKKADPSIEAWVKQ